MEQVLIFANPIAGRGKGQAIAKALSAHLGKRYRISTFFSKPTESAYDPSAGSVRAAIVIGGDGTLRGVAQWAIDQAIDSLCPSEKLRELPYPLLVIPMGTANPLEAFLAQFVQALHQQQTPETQALTQLFQKIVEPAVSAISEVFHTIEQYHPTASPHVCARRSPRRAR